MRLEAVRGGRACVGGAVVAEEVVEVLAAAGFGGVGVWTEGAAVDGEGCHCALGGGLVRGAEVGEGDERLEVWEWFFGR